MTRSFARLAFCSLLLTVSLSGCGTSIPDNRIKLMPSADGKRVTAVPPDCLSWTEHETRTFENTPWPQYGCATARNLAAQVERPQDLVDPNDLGEGDGVFASATIQNYRAGRTKPLIDAKADAPMASSPTGAGSTPSK